MISPKLSVFISHSSLDSEISADIYDNIKEHVAFTWLDQIELIPGTVLLSRINEGIARAQILIIVVSKNSLKSHWVNYEWTTFVHKKISENSEIYLIPYLLENLELPAALSRYKYIMHSENRNSFMELSSGVKRIALDYIDNKRGFKFILSDYTERIRDKNTTIVTHRKVFLPIGKPFKEMDLHHWQDKSGEISIVRLKFYDNLTGKPLNSTGQVLQHDKNNLVVNCILDEEFNDSIVFLTELHLTNYYPFLFKKGTGYTDLVILYPCEEVKYRFIVPNKLPYQKLEVKTEYKEGQILAKAFKGDEIIHSFNTAHTGYDDTLRFTISLK
jgi:hypothetical protein